MTLSHRHDRGPVGIVVRLHQPGCYAQDQDAQYRIRADGQRRLQPGQPRPAAPAGPATAASRRRLIVLSAGGQQIIGGDAPRQWLWPATISPAQRLQARQMLARRSSREISLRFFASYVGGYVIWLFYGLSADSTPLIVVNTVGVLCGGLTLTVALALRRNTRPPSVV